jgi:hypothetical protein
MFHDFKIVLDPPLRGFYTYEDDVSGKVLFESSHEEKIGWVYVFFHGYVHAQIIRRANLEHSRNHPRQYSTKYPLQEKQKETLIQTHLKLYEGHEKLHKKVRYEWPFTFNFQAERGKGDTLPTSGKYSYTYDQNPHSSVEYKVMAIGGEIGQMDDHIRTLLNPEDPLYLEEEYGKSAGLLTKLREKIGGATEQELRFVQIRPNITIDQSMTSSSSTELNIESYHLPYLAPSPEDRGHILRPDNVTFNFNIQVPRNIVIGEPFPLLLSGASKSELWNQNPPQVMLTSFKIEAWVKDFATINGREDEELKLYPIWERKHLKILVGTGGLDLGAIYGFSLAGEEIVPSFKTMLLERRYDLKAEFKIEVGGKSYSVFAAIPIEGHVLSPLVASSSQPVRSEERTSRLKPQRHLAAPISPRDTTSIKFQRTHIGRFSQQVKGVHGDHSIMEAAIAVSKILTDSGVQHVFSGDTTIELLPYIDYDPSFIPSSDDTGKLQRLFSQKGSPFQVLPFDESGTPVIELLYNDEKDSEKTTIVTFSGRIFHRYPYSTFV